MDVYLVIRDTSEAAERTAGSEPGTIVWMNVSEVLRRRPDKKSRQIVFEGEKLDAMALWRVRDRVVGRPKER